MFITAYKANKTKFWDFKIEPTTRIELVTFSLPRKRSTPELRRHSYIWNWNKIERKTGFEPATFSLEGWRSTNWATSAYLFIISIQSLTLSDLVVGRAGFEPAKVKPADLQSALVGRLSISPNNLIIKPIEGLPSTSFGINFSSQTLQLI